ncbi:hypothetical protein VL20_5473 [Microcystis panniformis FACHB-1757]|uniref:Uncharacterized protein n=1 Tax=Microcystis panniformis FACHB-1757 TaxID=1638788 RepID=A0A0K1S8I8_9CHRO|nr:hypothetical protein VL20_5473 [Microcystis panniformis FACHB-1757]
MLGTCALIMYLLGDAVRPYIVDKIRYCRGARLAPSDRLGYYSHASPLSQPNRRLGH